jgi:hypothetical protein
MKNLLSLLLFVPVILLADSTNADFISPVVEKVNSYYTKLGKLAREKKISEIQKALSEIDAILQKEPNNAIKCSCWDPVFGCIGNGHLNHSELIQTGIDRYLDKVVNLEIESLDSKLKQISLLQILLRHEFLSPSDKNIKSKHAKRVTRLIELVMEMYVRYEPDWNPDDPKHIVISESKIYNVISNITPNPVTEPEEAKKYERFCRRVAEYWQKRQDQKILAIFPKFFDTVNKIIIDSYSMEPRNDNDLIQLLEKSKYPFVEQIKILCQLNIPYKGFRNWESTDKLFKATAKFISLEKGEVNLEKADSKKTSIELSVLRKEDQDYVKRQLESEKKTIDDEKVKKD